MSKIPLGLTPEQIEESKASLPDFDSAAQAIESLMHSLSAATKATIALLAIGIEEIESGRFGLPTANDAVHLNKLRALLDRLNK
jgi:hypothetical protein